MKYYSVIIPTFNSASTITRCLGSLLNQTFKDIEIVIADGLSIDDTLGIVQEINDERIVIYSEKDTGVYDAMNKAVKKAQGKWILFLGSDDFLYDEFVLEKMKYQLERTTAKLVYGDVKILGHTPWAEEGEIYRGQITISQLFQFNICHQCIFYDNSIFKTRRYNLRYSICADYDFNLYCAANYKIAYHPIIVSNFVAGGLSTTLVDDAFGDEKWENIIVYFQNKLLDIYFISYRMTIKRTIMAFFKKGEISHAMLALKIFSYLSLKRIFNKKIID